jgi:filamentous hemagglutinin family protein
VRHPFFFLTLPLATIFSLTYFTVAKAQITPDNSLGAQPSVVTPNVQINGTPSDRIDGGAIRGDNLFHSFQEFNVNAGRGAYFFNPQGIANILTRVTGGNVSNIQGVLGVLGNANLFFINPNGIVFGPNARLDVGGSFLGSTANSLIFKNGFEFSATNPQAPPLLTINVPIGLGFRNNPGNITTQSTTTDEYARLQVPEGNSLTLVGGNVILNRPDLLAPGGRVELGGLSAPGTVGINGDGSLSFPVGVQRADVSLINNAGVVVSSSGGGGSIVVNARNLDISGGSGLYAGIRQGSGSAGSQAGDITLDATGDIKVVGKSYVFNDVLEQAVGNGGSINITTDSLSLTDGAQLSASTFGQGNTGNVSVRASGAVELAGSNTIIFSTVEAGGVGNGGDINIKAATLLLKDGAELQTLVRQASDTQPAGKGDAGNVTVDVTGSVTIAGVKDEFPSGIFSQVEGGVGNAGDITIFSGSLSLTDGARLSARTFGQGDAGSVSVQASGAVELGSNTRIFSTVEAGGVGNGGDINIKAATLSLKDGAQLQTLVREASGNQPAGRGNAGNVSVDVTGSVTIAGVGGKFPSAIGSIVGTGAVGNGGDIKISSGSFSLTDGAILAASTLGQGNAGNVSVRASGAVELGSNTGIFSTVESTGKGNGGNININAPKVSLNDRAQVTASSNGNGAAGDIEVLARSIRLDNGSIIKADTVGEQGNITLNARDYVLLRHESKITTNATGLATGGNITINAGNLVAFPSENSDITANAINGSGGKITINTQGLFGIQRRSELTPESDITAFSQQNPSLNGTINIVTPDIDPTQGLFELTEAVIDPAQQVAQNPCIKGFGSTFTITGRGGLPSDPNKILSSDNVRVDLIQPIPSTVSSTSATQKQPSQKPPVKQIIPAQGWIYNEKGQVVLVGYDPTKTGPQREQPAPNSSCAAVK